jgi:hypothetical protein
MLAASLSAVDPSLPSTANFCCDAQRGIPHNDVVRLRGHMRRCEFIAFLGSVAPSLVASPLAARAQQPSRTSRASGFA